MPTIHIPVGLFALQEIVSSRESDGALTPAEFQSHHTPHATTTPAVVAVPTAATGRESQAHPVIFKVQDPVAVVGVGTDATASTDPAGILAAAAATDRVLAAATEGMVRLFAPGAVAERLVAKQTWQAWVSESRRRRARERISGTGGGDVRSNSTAWVEGCDGGKIVGGGGEEVVVTIEEEGEM